MLKVAVFNFKGGTGKSTTTLNLGTAMASPKRRILLVDLDGQRTLSFGLGMDGQTPTALDWLTSDGLFTPLATKTKNLSLIPGDISLFRMTAQADLFTPALSVAACNHNRLGLQTRGVPARISCNYNFGSASIICN